MTNQPDHVAVVSAPQMSIVFWARRVRGMPVQDELPDLEMTELAGLSLAGPTAPSALTTVSLTKVGGQVVRKTSIARIRQPAGTLPERSTSGVPRIRLAAAPLIERLGEGL